VSEENAVRIFRISIPAPIKGKQRARGTKEGVHFTPKQTVNAEAWIRLCCTQQVGTPCLAGPVAVRIGLLMVLPKHLKKHAGEAAAQAWLPTSKPDFDNAAKLVCDALNGIAWRDDAAIADGRVLKGWAPAGTPARTVVEWWQMAPGEAARDILRLIHGQGAPVLAEGLL